MIGGSVVVLHVFSSVPAWYKFNRNLYLSTSKKKKKLSGGLELRFIMEPGFWCSEALLRDVSRNAFG